VIHLITAGPNSVAKCDIRPMVGSDGGGTKYKVSFIPVETGLYTIRVKWRGKDITGECYTLPTPGGVTSESAGPVRQRDQ